MAYILARDGVAVSYFKVRFSIGGRCHSVDKGGIKFRGVQLGLAEPHSCLPGRRPSLWLVLGSASTGSGEEEGRLSVKSFIILSPWRLFKT